MVLTTIAKKKQIYPAFKEKTYIKYVMPKIMRESYQ